MGPALIRGYGEHILYCVLILYWSGNMENTLIESSGIWTKKSKFFIYRALAYSFFLLFPIWAQKTLELPLLAQVFIMVLYILFMVSQWFLLGKEIDYRLKIYFRVNSSMDRVIYRLLLGMIAMLLYFNLLSFLDSKWIYNSFWLTWVALGLFYSWPTRGRIIRESVSSNFGEFYYLDSFEKTLVGLILVMFVFSIPELPMLGSREGLQLFFDPQEAFSTQVWNFLVVNYYPFQRYPELLNIAWSMHFYVVGLGLFLLCFYALLRFFVSRRLSLLGVFALISSWSFSKIMGADYGAALATTYSLFWVWSMLWVTKSGTYRSGLFLGLINYYGVLLNQTLVFLVFIQFALLYFFFLSDKTTWFKKQMFRYALFGLFLCLGVTLVNLEKFETLRPLSLQYWDHFIYLFNRKSIYALSFMGVLLMLIKLASPNLGVLKTFQIDRHRSLEFLSAIMCLFAYALIFERNLVSEFSLVWMFAFMSIIPLEFIFQSISRLRSRRNMIYVAYILICLLDSHFEGRVKIFIDTLL